MKLSRSGALSLRASNSGLAHRIFTQASVACEQFFWEVDTDSLRNQSEKLFNSIMFSLLGKERGRIISKLGVTTVLKLIVDNRLTWLRYHLYLDRKKRPERIGFRTPRERLLSQVVATAMIVTLTLISVITNATSSFETALISNGKLIAAPELTDTHGPKNWLDGSAELNGFRKDALSGPLQYAKDSGYEFAATKERLLELVETGTLVELEETPSLHFDQVSRPYVLPVVAEFVYRLADQYNFGQKCGPLVLTGAARDIAFQQTLGNGSAKSVHPAGMAVDLKSTGLAPRCQAWLEKTLLEIEAARRIDVTKEVSHKAPHYHVSVATHEYETWLERRRTVENPEVDALRTAMFYEGGPNETIEGYKAIGWVIRNRVRSKDYPNTIQAVVADGSVGKTDGGCQFSFMCDGKPEDRYELCRTANGTLTSYWRFKCDMRWEQVTVVAKAILTESKDPTGGATLYYATWMDPKPYWARSRTEIRADGKTISLPYGDFAHKPVQIGNHYFGCSLFAGKGICNRSTS